MPDEPVPPPADINVPPPDYLLAGKLHAEGVKDSGWIERAATARVVAMVKFLTPAMRILANVLDELLAAVAELFLAGQGEGSRGFAHLTAALVGDLLGVQVDGDTIFSAFQTRGRITAMQEVGKEFSNVLVNEFIQGGNVSPEQGEAAAKAFLGFVLSFAVRQGNVEFLTQLVPEEFRVAEGFRMYGELMAKNLGLGRLTRMVLKPLMTTLAATPFQWRLNQLYHPTQFKEGDLVNPFTQTLMDHDVVFKAMDLLGYSPDKIEQLMKLHQKRLTLDELDLMRRYSSASEQFVADYIKSLGWPEDLHDIALVLVDTKRADAAVRELVAAMETYVADGHVSTDEFSTMLDNLPLGPMEKRFLLARVQFKVKAPHNHLTLAQAQQAFEEGIWDLTQLENYFTARGYAADDVQTLELLTLLKLAKLDEAKKVAQFAYNAKVEKAKAKNAPIPPPPAILSS